MTDTNGAKAENIFPDFPRPARVGVWPGDPDYYTVSQMREFAIAYAERSRAQPNEPQANPDNVGGLPATGPFVDRLIRIFRYKPHDDTSALVLHDYAELCRAAPAGRDVCATCQGHGMIGWTTGQTPEQFDQHEAPCPDCSAPAHTSKKAPVAWLHTIHMELGQTSTLLTDSSENAFGIAGKDYSSEYIVTSEPLYTSTAGGEYPTEDDGLALELVSVTEERDFLRRRVAELSAPAGWGEVDIGGWLWGKLMDFCKGRRFHPAEFNDLFAIVSELRALLRKLQQGADDPLAMLAFMLNNHATVETDGCGNWRVAYEWTSPPTYGPYAAGRYPAIEAAMIAASQGQEGGK